MTHRSPCFVSTPTREGKFIMEAPSFLLGVSKNVSASIKDLKERSVLCYRSYVYIHRRMQATFSADWLIPPRCTGRTVVFTVCIFVHFTHVLETCCLLEMKLSFSFTSTSCNPPERFLFFVSPNLQLLLQNIFPVCHKMHGGRSVRLTVGHGNCPNTPCCSYRSFVSATTTTLPYLCMQTVLLPWREKLW